MSRAILTVTIPGHEAGYDLELPTDLPASRLAGAIARALGAPGDYRLEVHPPGRLLSPDESLAQAGAGDGAWLLLQPA